MNEPLTINVIVSNSDENDRIDRWLAEYLDKNNHAVSTHHSIEDHTIINNIPHLSRSRIKTLITQGNLTLDGKVMDDPSRQVRTGNQIILTLPPPQDATPQAQDIPLDVLHEDSHLIVINKPAGLVTHPAPGTPDGTLVNALINHCGDSLTGIGGEKRPGIVHRLDKDTSGVMLAAKTAEAHAVLTEMFAAHDLERIYTAIVWGIPAQRQQTINAPIGRNARDRKKMTINSKGKDAITHVSFERTLPPLASVAECQLETGRTHQIRVHLTHIGHSVIGDAQYGRPMRSNQMPDNALKNALAGLRGFPRQALHASHLGFRHPITSDALEFSTPLPHDMRALLDTLESDLKMRANL